MSIVKSKDEFIVDYESISRLCHASGEPVIISNEGKDDLVAMSLESYQCLVSRFELYSFVSSGMADIENGDVKPFAETIKENRAKRGR